MRDEKKIGHTGTLDPEATGVLPVCCGKATKVLRTACRTKINRTAQNVPGSGVETDTQDMLSQRF